MGRVSRRATIAELNEKGFVSKTRESKVYKVGIYARLSIEDKSTETINTQVYFIKKYIEEQPHLNLVDVFTDNGFSGTDFQRPGFDSLMKAVRNGEINCIVVKDFSRFGRNYLETGSYLENIFPFIGVRFISINDGYDSNNPMDGNTKLSISIKNLTNEQFARDISKKIKSTYRTKQANGEFLGTFAPYGYAKSREDKHRLVVDDEAAKVVLYIFEQRATGMSYYKIADDLNIKRIDSPMVYRVRKGLLEPTEKRLKVIWNPSQVRKILQDEVYIGHIVQGKTSKSKFAGNKWIYHSREDWIVVKNMHEPIIPMDLWEKVQQIFEETHQTYAINFGKYSKGYKRSENILTKKIFCGDCGKPITRSSKYYANGERYFQYDCTHKNKDGKLCPSKHMLETKLYELIYKSIRLQIDLCVEYKKHIEKLENQEDVSLTTTSLNKKLTDIANAIKCKIQRKTLLYDDYAEGNINREDYIMISRQYEREIEELSDKRLIIEETLENRRSMFANRNGWMKAFDKFRRSKKLSKEMVDTLIKRITIVTRGSIEIEFNFQDEFKQLLQNMDNLQTEVKKYE